jgi:tryptophan synthase alpha chain
LVKIQDAFEKLRAKSERALVLFVTAGDQPLNELGNVLSLLVEGGADLIEVGIPFSDPFGEGPTIQASSQRSLDAGTTPEAILDALSNLQLPVPVVTMGYYNTYLRHGLGAIAAKSAGSGVSGAIISDLVPEEGEAWNSAARENGLDTIYLAAPTSTEERVSSVCSQSTGFIYAVSRTGVTGVHSGASPELGALIDRIRAQTSLPICVGFGISSPGDVAQVCKIADGAVVGSYMVNLLHQKWTTDRKAILDSVKSLKAATR